MQRLIGYGAYNLGFDKLLGKPMSGTGPIFFQYLRQNGWPINHVKIICFRNALLEGLPAARAVTLYNGQKAINTAFLDNVDHLCDQARQFGFQVEVCIFHYHAIVNPAETPEHVPDLLDPAKLGDTNEAKVQAFFSLGNEARVAEQVKLVRALGDRLRRYDNVLFELGNELRDPQGNDAAHCAMLGWMNRMRAELVTSLQGAPARIGTSTGLLDQNEKLTFQPVRPVEGCSRPALKAEYFDFHFGQWSGGGNFAAGIAAAKQRAAGYHAGAPLLVNDDGAGAQRTPAHVESWARCAFTNGLSYTSKQPYPPGAAWDLDALGALKRANGG
ncbi:MAG: hypothetical protein U0359_20305 [Byssovorax sp.]